MIKIFYSETKEGAGALAALSFADTLNKKPNALLGLATGSSPIPMYGELIRMYKEGAISFRDATTVNLDEYVGLTATHDQSYAYFMSENLFSHVDIDMAKTNLPNGVAADPIAECKRYNSLLASLGKRDIQVLGIGLNGHIGFNEPSDIFVKETEVVDLTPSTIKANSRFFASEADVPTQAYSMGIGQILASDKIILLASGAAKAQILERALFGNVTPSVPASILQFADNVEVYADKEALSEIIAAHPDSVIY